MTTSIKELSIVEPQLHPTLIDLPSTNSIVLTLQQIDEKTAAMTPDVYTMCKLANEIKQTILHLQCRLELYRGYATRLMGLVRCIIAHFGVNCYYYSQLIACIRTCNGKWKRLLFKAIKMLNLSPGPNEIFLYRAERNTYILAVIRSYNTNILKLLEKLTSRNYLNDVTKKYLKSKGMQRHYECTYARMVEILNEKEDETSIKIYLIQEFIKYLLNYLHFCISEKQSLIVFQHFYTVSLYLCRIIKKFHHNDLWELLRDSLKLILSGFQAYVDIFEKSSYHSLKVQQAQLMIRLLNRRKSSAPKVTNKDSFAIRLLTKILFNWRQIRQRSSKMRSFSLQNEENGKKNFKNASKVKKIKQNLYKAEAPEVKLETLKINRSLSHLNKRKSVSSSKYPQGCLPHHPSKVKLRNEIQLYARNYFQRPKSLHLPGNVSIDKKKDQTKKSLNIQEKQLRLQDYAVLLNNKIKVVPSTNKIQLYQADKMKHFYPSRPKAKLRLV